MLTCRKFFKKLQFKLFDFVGDSVTHADGQVDGAYSSTSSSGHARHFCGVYWTVSCQLSLN